MTYDQNIQYFVYERELRLSETYLIGLYITSYHSKHIAFKALRTWGHIPFDDVECELYPRRTNGYFERGVVMLKADNACTISIHRGSHRVENNYNISKSMHRISLCHT